jgi:catechol 2,3-dioxygenase-like lactoylglutathione lyase family enzyme
VNVADHLPWVASRAQEAPGELVEAEGLGAGQLDRVVHWRADRDIGQGAGDIVRRLGLNEGGRQPNGVAVGARVGDGADELEELRRADDRVGRDRTCRVTIRRAVPNISADRPAETRDFFAGLLGFEVTMDMGWIVTVASRSDPAVQVSIIGNDDPAAPGISVEVADVDAVHARALERGLEITYPLRDEEWGVRRFMLREPSGTTVNVLSHRSD